MIINSDGGHLTPSMVAYIKTGERLVGQLVKILASINSEQTVCSAKRNEKVRAKQLIADISKIGNSDKSQNPDSIVKQDRTLYQNGPYCGALGAGNLVHEIDMILVKH